MAPTATFDGPLPGGSPGAEVRVHPLTCAITPAPMVYFERPTGRLMWPRALAGALTTPRSKWLRLPLPAFLVEHPTAGALMIDTGPPASFVNGATEDLGRVGGTILKADMQPGQAAGDQARALGHDPEQIGLVVMTHLHYDHLGGSAQFPNAEFLATRTEWDDPASPSKGTYPHHRKAVNRLRLLDDHAIPGEPFGGFSQTWDLFGDGSVRLAWTPGHAPGHVSVLLRLAGGKPALLTADAAYTRHTIDGRLVPLLCPDVPAYLRSLDEITAHLAQTPDLVVVCGHDPFRWEADSAALAAAV